MTIITALLAVCASLFGQRDETVFGEAGLKLTGAWGGTLVGITGFKGENASLRGGFGTLEFNKTLLLGFGGYNTDAVAEFRRGERRRFDLSYGGLMLGYVPNSHRPIHPKFSFTMGGGEIKIKDEDKDKVFVVQPGAGIEANLFQWFKLSLEGGYRFLSGSNLASPANDNLSGFFGELKFRFGWSWGNP